MDMPNLTTRCLTTRCVGRARPDWFVVFRNVTSRHCVWDQTAAILRLIGINLYSNSMFLRTNFANLNYNSVLNENCNRSACEKAHWICFLWSPRCISRAKKTDLFHKCSTGKLNYRRSSIADSSLVRMAFSGNQSVVFIIALNKPGPPSSVYSLDWRTFYGSSVTYFRYL